MSAVTLVVTAGAVLGAGLWLAWSGWTPRRVPLADTLARLGQPIAVSGPANRDARLGAWARRLSLVDRTVASMRTDLRVLRRSADEQAAMFVVYALCGLLWAPVVAGICWMVGVRFPVAVPLWLALIGAVIGAVSAVRPVRVQAAARRRSFAHALGSYCDVVGLCLSAGRGVDASIQTAAAAGNGWPFAELQAALRTGYVRGERPWQALDALAAECDLPDLAELAAALSLAGDEGAAVRDTVRSKARSIRQRLTANAEREAAAVTERMSVPATFLLLGFIVFLGFPSVHVLL